jgi:hypothetical protein
MNHTHDDDFLKATKFSKKASPPRWEQYEGATANRLGKPDWVFSPGSKVKVITIFHDASMEGYNAQQCLRHQHRYRHFLAGISLGYWPQSEGDQLDTKPVRNGSSQKNLLLGASSTDPFGLQESRLPQ